MMYDDVGLVMMDEVGTFTEQEKHRAFEKHQFAPYHGAGGPCEARVPRPKL